MASLFGNISQKQTFGSPFAAVCIGNVYIADSEIPGLAVSLEIGSDLDFAKIALSTVRFFAVNSEMV